MEVPKEYEGREQSWLKHRVLYDYVLPWGLKLGSRGRRAAVRLCYVDGFAGPWRAANTNLQDTSIAIGLRALEEAAKVWRDQGAQVRVDAMFIEKDAAAYAQLDAYVRTTAKSVKVTTRHGEFGTFVAEVQAWLASDAAFIFVDPTGWKGAAMRYIAPLIRGSQQRDVLINLMYDHLNRFKYDERAFLREQMRDFFGLLDRDLPENLSERELFALYRQQLKTTCGLQYAADLAIPDPDSDRTKFGLVIGGNNSMVLKLFRDVERKVVGVEARDVLTEAAARRDFEASGGQMSFLAPAPVANRRYDTTHAEAVIAAPAKMLTLVKERGPSLPT